MPAGALEAGSGADSTAWCFCWFLLVFARRVHKTSPRPPNTKTKKVGTAGVFLGGLLYLLSFGFWSPRGPMGPKSPRPL